MHEPELRRSRAGQLAIIGLVVSLSGVSCSSTSTTNVIASNGGNSGAEAGAGGDSGMSTVGGESGETSGGAAGGLGNGGSETAGGGTAPGGAGNADCSAGATLAPELHAACIEALGEGKVRITYDFANADQALDWSPSTDASVSVAQRALIVSIPTSEGIGVAIFKRKLHVDKVSFNVTLLSGNTTNWYVNTIWSGSWTAESGYGSYHDYTGRGFITNGTEYPPVDISPLSVGVMHKSTVAQSDTQLTWDMDGTVITEAVAPLPVTDRILALGVWQSSAAYYNVVFEGTLN